MSANASPKAARREIYIAGVATTPFVPAYRGNEVELVQSVIRDAIGDAGVTTGLSASDIEFTTASSSDSFAGQAFAFVRMLDASGAYPTIEDSHLDMDGAWALYEAWVRLQVGDIDTALVYALGRSSSGRVEDVSPHTLDPYYLAPLGLDTHAMAALQASALLHAGLIDRAELDSIVTASREAAANSGGLEDILAFTATRQATLPSIAPMSRAELPTPADGAAAVVITTRRPTGRAVRLRAMQHRTDAHSPGTRSLVDVPSLRLALDELGLSAAERDTALVELHARYPHELALLANTLGRASADCIPANGGAFCADPIMASGLVRHIHAVRRLRAGEGRHAIAHASSGPALQQNLVSLLEVCT